MNTIRPNSLGDQNMSYDRKKATEKAKRTRAKNKREKEKQDKKYSLALSRARNAENKLKSYKEGFKDGIASMK